MIEKCLNLQSINFPPLLTKLNPRVRLQRMIIAVQQLQSEFITIFNIVKVLLWNVNFKGFTGSNRYLWQTICDRWRVIERFLFFGSFSCTCTSGGLKRQQNLIKISTIKCFFGMNFAQKNANGGIRNWVSLQKKAYLK